MDSEKDQSSGEESGDEASGDINIFKFVKKMNDTNSNVFDIQ